MTKFFEIDFLEAGEKGSGDAITLRYRDEADEDFIHVVDGGYTADGDKIVEHIRTYYGNVDYIDRVVLTHPDADHAAGLKKVLEEFNVGELWMNRPWNHIEALQPLFDYEYTEDGLIQRLKRDFPFTAELESIAEEKGIVIRDAFQGSQIGVFTILAPSMERYIELIVESEKTPEAERAATIAGKIFESVVSTVKRVAAIWGAENLKGESDGTSRENESSIVQFADLCDQKILLTGDGGIEALEEAYQYAIRKGIVLPGIDVFDVPHHGSRRNVSSDVLDKILGPKLLAPSESPNVTAVVSANRNDENHPKNATVRALHHRGAQVLRTNGTIQVYGGTVPHREGWGPAQVLGYPTDMEE